MKPGKKEIDQSVYFLLIEQIGLALVFPQVYLVVKER